MKILVLSKYDRFGASSRLRIYQYLPFLEKSEIDIDLCALLGQWYIEYLYSTSKNKYPLWRVVVSYFGRFLKLLKCKRYDLVWIQREVFPWMPAFAERFLLLGSIPYVVDYDDAIFHYYEQHRFLMARALLGRKIPFVMKNASLVLAGNEYLFEKAVSSGSKRVEIFPTVVDVSRYQLQRKEREVFTIGWIGTPKTCQYLNMIITPLEKILLEGVRLKLVGISKTNFPLSGDNIEFIDWSEEKEVDSILKFDVGIMPLPDLPWERGKCGYKLIQYMACGKPVIASPVGVNSKIVKHGFNGFLAENEKEWLYYLNLLRSDCSLGDILGNNGRRDVEKNYNLELHASKLISWFKQLQR